MDNQADSLPDLTEKQINFVLAIHKGLSKSDAYREAYSTEGWSQAAIWVNPSKLASNAKLSL